VVVVVVEVVVGGGGGRGGGVSAATAVDISVLAITVDYYFVTQTISVRSVCMRISRSVM
jgi:hypothetical protein